MDTEWMLAPDYDVIPSMPVSIERRDRVLSFGDMGRRARAEILLSQCARFLLGSTRGRVEQNNRGQDRVGNVVFESSRTYFWHRLVAEGSLRISSPSFKSRRSSAAHTEDKSWRMPCSENHRMTSHQLQTRVVADTPERGAGNPPGPRLPSTSSRTYSRDL
jgi:hypothetical protein